MFLRELVFPTWYSLKGIGRRMLCRLLSMLQSRAFFGRLRLRTFEIPEANSTPAVHCFKFTGQFRQIDRMVAVQTVYGRFFPVPFLQ